MLKEPDLSIFLANTHEIQIEVKGRVSGKTRRLPVWFTNDSHHVYLVPVQGSDSQWFKNVVKNPHITLTVGKLHKQMLAGEARPIRDAERVAQIVEQFRTKYGVKDVARYYSKLDVAVEVQPKPT